MQAWVPVPAVDEAGWARSGPARWTTNAPVASLVNDPSTGARIVHGFWGAGISAPALDVVFEASARDRAVDLKRRGGPVPLPPKEHARWMAPTALIPTDGIVWGPSGRITAGAAGDVQKARRIYD